MPAVTPDFILDEIPGAESIRMFRDEARDSDQSVSVAFRSAAGTEQMLVVSNRGTCVVLEEEVSVATFNRETPPDEVATALASGDYS